jgi:hypothetical protein
MEPDDEDTDVAVDPQGILNPARCCSGEAHNRRPPSTEMTAPLI